MAIKLLHCADLHLDAVLGDGINAGYIDELSPEERSILRDSPILALKSISNICATQDIDLVVIAGDIFDRKENTAVIKSAQIKFTSFLHELDRLGTKVFIALGNHDPLSTIAELKKSWPNNTHVFATSPETINLEIRGERVAIHGASFATNDESRDLASIFPNKVSSTYNVGVLHTNVNSDSNHKNYAPSSVPTLTSLGYDYFALGHIHKREVISDFPMVAYSGNSQGLSAKPSEQEPKGCIVATLNQPGSSVETTFETTDNVRYITIDLSCPDATGFEDIIESYDDKIRELNLDSSILYLVRLNISLPDIGFFIDEDTARYQLNEMRSNAIITKVKLSQSLDSWEKLVENEDFFARINEALLRTDFDIDIYGDKQQKIEQFLPSEAESSVEDQRNQVIETLVGAYSELRNKGNV